MYNSPPPVVLQDSGASKLGEGINSFGGCGQSGSAIVKRLKLDLAGISSRSDPSEDDVSLTLNLAPPVQDSSHEERRPPIAPACLQQATSPGSSEQERCRSRRRQTPVDHRNARRKEEVIPPPYVWATDRRAVVHPLDRITQSGVISIQEEVICKRCDRTQKVDINLQASFLQLENYFMSNRDVMHDRAPKSWMVPRLLDCTLCHQTDCVKPVINPRKRDINWLFLMLTGTLGLCTLDQLKYFCKHTHKHRTGAKDRVLYLTYVGLLNQLNPGGHYQ